MTTTDNNRCLTLLARLRARDAQVSEAFNVYMTLCEARSAYIRREGPAVDPKDIRAAEKAWNKARYARNRAAKLYSQESTKEYDRRFCAY